MRTVAEILKRFPRACECGLTAEESQRSQQEFGPNKLTPLPREPLWKKFLEKFDEPIIKILLAAAVLSIVVDLFKASTLLGAIGLGLVAVTSGLAFVLKKQHWLPSILFVSAMVLFIAGLVKHDPSVEGLAVMVAVILATGVAFLSEYRSDQEFEKLNAQKDSLKVKVIRAGDFHTVPLEAVVVGDLVKLETGDEVPGDGRLLKAVDLMIDQSLMTGESAPVKKSPRPAEDAAEGFEQPGCIYRGTQVVDGVADMLVTEVGDASYLGQIARKLSADDGDEEAEAGANTEETRVKRKLIHLQGPDAAAGQAPGARRADQQDRLHRRRAHLLRPAAAWDHHRAKSTRPRTSTIRSRCSARCSTTSCSWSSSSWWRCPKGCR